MWCYMYMYGFACMCRTCTFYTIIYMYVSTDRYMKQTVMVGPDKPAIPGQGSLLALISREYVL